MTESVYKAAGVDIAAKNHAFTLMRQAVQSTYGPEVLRGIGAFGGMFDASAIKDMAAPVLVASTDGVGTKVKIAAALGRYDTIGQDLVNHSVNDILAQGARPLFFLDYFATSRLVPDIVAAVVTGCAEACRAVGCALLGGETAEMPGVYQEGEFDLAGTIVGVVDRADVIDGRAVRPGDALLGLASTGLHTNGYSLARRVFAGYDLRAIVPELGQSLGDALLATHRHYLHHVRAVQQGGVQVKAMAHITGGGIVDNLPRCLPDGVGARVRLGSWPVPTLFALIQRLGNIADAEMRHALNLGIGLILIVAPEQADAALRILSDAALPGGAWLIGETVAGQGVEFVG